MAQKKIFTFFTSKDGADQPLAKRRQSSEIQDDIAAAPATSSTLATRNDLPDTLPSTSREDTTLQISFSPSASTSTRGKPPTDLLFQSPVMPLDEPYHPKEDYVFPAKSFTKETFTRSCQKNWFKKWPWLSYVIENDSVVCSVCVTAVRKKLICESVKREYAFIRDGYTNWRRATEKFPEHECSQFHSEAVEKLASLGCVPINTMMSDSTAKSQNTARIFLQILFGSIRLLGRQGIAFRSHEHRDGILWQLMQERSKDTSANVKGWLEQRNNWMSDTIQNEIIEMFGHAIQQKIIAQAMDSPFFGLSADGTTDISTDEQFSCNLQYVDRNLTVHNQFLGFYNAPDTTAETLFICIKDVLLRMTLPLDRLQGYCFDGASNVSGRLSGVQARLKEVCPDSLFVHCSNHSLDLVLQEVARDVHLVADTLNFVQEMSVVIHDSSKRKQIYESVFGCGEAVTNLASLCPTRWCVRTTAISRVCSVYSVLLETLAIFQADATVRGETRAKITGLLKRAKNAKTYFGLLCCEAIFSPCEVVAKVLQSVDATALGAIESVTVLAQNITALRDDMVFQNMLKKVHSCASTNELKFSQPKRATKTPVRFRQTTAAEELVSDAPEEAWKREFYEALDLVNAEIQRRFSQEGMTTASNREKLLLESAAGSSKRISDNPSAIAKLCLPLTFDASKLQSQLLMLGNSLKGKDLATIGDITKFIKNLQPQTRKLYVEVEKLIKLCLCLPVSVAGSERTFSALRRLKTWVRSTMSQKRLTHLALMHMHNDILDGLDIETLMKQFISKTPERKSTFGVLPHKKNTSLKF